MYAACCMCYEWLAPGEVTVQLLSATDKQVIDDKAVLGDPESTVGCIIQLTPLGERFIVCVSHTVTLQTLSHRWHQNLATADV